ncbi:type III secretion effector protein [Pseudomonas sp. ADAK18]|uniref:type III secretion effector protein n=1 Tax=Pseudomonas sp. ADAK18 TaxID=2730848 RepID=UPI001463C706|nr:type III secretion effector protein [Pseudomonas sp. ADAK18]QJI28399.1 type III secretion effector protein [Pseudomonas sp. ADAK18]
MKNEGLKLASLQRIASEKMGPSQELNNSILLAKALIRRPRLIDAILDEDGFITRQSLLRAAKRLFGNSDPDTFSPDPFHAKTNVELVQAFQAMFEAFRDKSQDRTVFFEKIGYVKIERLVAISKDPNEIDTRGDVVLDLVTGLPRKKYDEQHVYMSKNLVYRPGLLRSLESIQASGRRMFGSHYQRGWLSNKDVECWLKNNTSGNPS